MSTEAGLLQVDSSTRQKIITLLQIKNFDLEMETLSRLKNFWLEDIETLYELKKTKMLKYVDIYDGVGKCVDIFKNPGIQIQKQKICDIEGSCQVFQSQCVPADSCHVNVVFTTHTGPYFTL